MRLNFYPRPPRGGRPRLPISLYLSMVISIHALREEGDPPCHRRFGSSKISIHALREEGDAERQGRQQGRRDFYPRPPRGGRLSV